MHSISLSIKEYYIYYSKRGLEKNADFRGSKVFVKIKKGQKKCPFFKSADLFMKTRFSKPVLSIML